MELEIFEVATFEEQRIGMMWKGRGVNLETYWRESAAAGVCPLRDDSNSAMVPRAPVKKMKCVRMNNGFNMF